MSDYFKAIDKNGKERKFALDLKQYILFVDEESCSRIQEIRKIINPSNDLDNILMKPKVNHYLEDDTPFYYYKKKNCDGVYYIIHPKNLNKKKSLFYLPLLSPHDVTGTKMYWEDDVNQVIREPEYKQFELEVGGVKVYTNDGKYTSKYIELLKRNRKTEEQMQKNLSNN